MSQPEYVWVWEPDGPDGTGFYATVTWSRPDITRVRVVTRGTPPRRTIGEHVDVPTSCVRHYLHTEQETDSS